MGRQLLLVGLGNVPLPGTRHSVGHLLVDALAARLAVPTAPSKALDGVLGRSHVVLGGSTVDLALFKPGPLMNITGPSVAAALRHTTDTPRAMILVHDSLQHKPNTLSVRFGGSHNGHNGVRSVIAALGGDPNFYRFRIGIGRDGDAASYVLGRLSSAEKAYWGSGGGLDMVCKELITIALQLPVT